MAPKEEDEELESRSISEEDNRKRSAPAADNGNDGSANGGEKKTRKRVQESEPSSYPFLTAASADGSEVFWKEGLPLLGDQTVKEMERKWREFHQEAAHLKMKRLDLEAQLNSEEAQLNLKRSDLARELTAALLKAFAKKQSDG